MESGLLRMHIKTLRLRLDAPWPSQLKGRATRFLLGRFRRNARRGATNTEREIAITKAA